MELNFGATPFKFPSAGYIAVSEAPNEHTQSSPNIPAETDTSTTSRPDNAPMCVIIEPTKELAEQTHAQIEQFKKYLDSPKIRLITF